MMTFAEVVQTTVATPGFLLEYDRLRGTSFAKPASGITQAIDRATGKRDADVVQLLAFIHDAVWVRLLAQEPVR